MSLKKALHWRYAAKRMTGERVPEDKVEAILEAAQYAPTSMGFQPFTIFVTDNRALLEKIKPIAANQPQVTEASHLLIFAAWTNVTERHVDEYLDNIIAVRGVTTESLKGFRNSMMRFIKDTSKAEKLEWAARQAYIAFGFAMAEAAMLEVDTTPMEGFNATALDKLLGFKEMGLHSITLLPLGYRDEKNDFLATSEKVRRPKEKLIVRL